MIITITPAVIIAATIYSMFARRQWFSNLSKHQNSLEGLFKFRLLGSTPELFFSTVVKYA